MGPNHTHHDLDPPARKRARGSIVLLLFLSACAQPVPLDPIPWPEMREENQRNAQALAAELAVLRGELGTQGQALSSLKKALEEDAKGRESLEAEVRRLAGALEAEGGGRSGLEAGLADLRAEGKEHGERLERRLEELALRLDQARGEAQAAREAARKAEATGLALGVELARQGQAWGAARQAGEETLERFRQLGARFEALEKEVRGLPAALAPPMPDAAALEADKTWEPSAGPGWGAWLLGGVALAVLVGGAIWAWRSRPRVLADGSPSGEEPGARREERPAPESIAREPVPIPVGPARRTAQPSPFDRPRERPGEAPPRRALAELRARPGEAAEALERACRRVLEASPLVLIEPAPEVVPDPEGGKVRIFFWTPGFAPEEEVEALRARVEALGREAGRSRPGGPGESCRRV